jgi:hypothetical protein
MSDKIGRNDNCTCGSGKKYKKCCGNASATIYTNADFQLRKLRQLEMTLVNKQLCSYVTEQLSPDIFKLALADFFPEDLPETLDKRYLFDHFFISWFLFSWKPSKKKNFPSFNSELTVSQNYLMTHPNRLSNLEKRFIDSIEGTYYSFYSIIDVIPEQSFVVKDIFLETTHTVKEQKATHTLKRGDIVFGRLFIFEEQTIFIGMAPYTVPAAYHLQLVDYKHHLVKSNKRKALTGESLREVYHYEMLDYFFWMLKDAYNSPLPSLENTDGDPLQFCKSYFKITLTPEETLKHLLPLALSKNPKEFLEDAKRDKNGRIKRIELPWLKKGNKRHRDWSNTILGHLVIEQGKLILETNSERRAERGKKLLIKSLSDAIVFQKMLIEAPAQKLKSPSKSPDLTSEHNKLLELPEVQEQLKNLAKAHWENWLDTPIPALGNKTPRAAAKTKNGKEKLEALLLEYERHDTEKKNNLFKADITDLKTKLGLAIPNPT